jgi:hypothetical protein
MIRGTTPTLEFVLPFDTKQLAEAYVTLAQNDEVVLDKRLSECQCSENKMTVRLSQEETLKLKCGCITGIQIRARTVDGEAIASDIIHEKTERILKDGVI